MSSNFHIYSFFKTANKVLGCSEISRNALFHVKNLFKEVPKVANYLFNRPATYSEVKIEWVKTYQKEFEKMRLDLRDIALVWEKNGYDEENGNQLRLKVSEIENICWKIFNRKSLWAYKDALDRKDPDNLTLKLEEKNRSFEDEKNLTDEFYTDLMGIFLKCALLLEKNIHEEMQSIKERETLALLPMIFDVETVEPFGVKLQSSGKKMKSRSVHLDLPSSIYSYKGKLYYVVHKRLQSMGSYLRGFSPWKKRGSENVVVFLHSLDDGTTSFVLRKPIDKINPLEKMKVAFLKNKAFLKCPNIVHEDLIYYIDRKGEEKIKFVTERWDLDFDEAKKNLICASLTKEQKRELIRDLVQGVKVIHDQKWCHRDLSSRNILIRQIGDKIQGGICDFGFAMNEENEKACMQHGTVHYAAPEYHISRGISQLPKTIVDVQKADIFSLGLIFFEILEGRDGAFRILSGQDRGWVFLDEAEFRNKDEALSGYFTSEEEEKKLIARMLNYDPNKRPTAQEVLSTLVQKRT